MDPNQVIRGHDGVLRCHQCGFEYTLSLHEIPDQAASGLEAVDAALAGVPEPDRGRRPSPDVWSVNAYMAHLADAAEVIDWRVTAIAAEDMPLLPNHDQDRAVEESRADEVPADASLDRLMKTVDGFRVRVQNLDPAAGQRVGVHSAAGEVRLSDIAHDMPHELHHHARDIRDVGEQVHRSDAAP